MKKPSHPLLPFLDSSPSVFHACLNVAQALREGGFSPLSEKEAWPLKKGGAFFVTRGDALAAAFRLPKKEPKRASILASHLDSPALKLKPHPDLSHASFSLFTTESYGAPLLHTWMDRDLRLAGQILGTDKKGSVHKLLIDWQDLPLIIPSLAIHLDRGVTEKGAVLNKQDHMRPVFAAEEKKTLASLVQQRTPIAHLLAADLYCAPLEKAALLGEENGLIASSRLDNLTSAHAALQAILEAKPQDDQIALSLFWHHEEIGSKSPFGADSLFALELLEKIASFYQMSREEFSALKSRSLSLSADVTHALHPNYPKEYDAENAPRLGQGPAVKYSAAQKYSTTARGAAFVKQLAQAKKIPLQEFASRSDLPSGSTVGPFLGSMLGIETVDLGIGCWGMHSARETVSLQDQKELQRLLTAALETPFWEL